MRAGGGRGAWAGNCGPVVPRVLTTTCRLPVPLTCHAQPYVPAPPTDAAARQAALVSEVAALKKRVAELEAALAKK